MYSDFIKVINTHNTRQDESFGNLYIINNHKFTGTYSIKMCWTKVCVYQVYVFRNKLKTLHTYRPHALRAYVCLGNSSIVSVHPGNFGIAGISIFNVGWDGLVGAHSKHIGRPLIDVGWPDSSPLWQLCGNPRVAWRLQY